MKLRKEKILTDVLLGAGLYLLDSMRDRLSDTVHEVRSRARDTYDTASDRVSRASDVLTGEDHSGIGTAAALLIGIGIGVGVGMLLRRPAASRLVETSPARPSTMATGSVSASPKNRNRPAAPTGPKSAHTLR